MDDPAKKQYWIFSAIIAFIFSFVLNFFFADMLQGPFFSGFPIPLADTSGFLNFIYKVLNTALIGGLLTPLIYFGIQWLQNRGISGGDDGEY